MANPDSPAFQANLAAALLGCGLCGGRVRTPPASDPFSLGPYAGRYWCGDCWTLYWNEHPEHLADAASRLYVAKEAMRIRAARGWELLFEEGENRAFLTERGTLIVQLAPVEGFGIGEYHPDQFRVLVRALREIDRKGVPGFSLEESAPQEA